MGYPLACERADDGLIVTFADIDPDAFVDPFADWTIERVRPATRQERLSVNDLKDLASARTPPNGLIFHIARCGSTLAAQMIAQIPSVTVYSEPSVLNDLLFPRNNAPPPSSAEIQAMVALLGQHAAQPYVVKCRSWHSLYAAQITQAVCETPWAFLYRDPVEVAVSVLRKPPTWLRSRALTANP